MTKKRKILISSNILILIVLIALFGSCLLPEFKEMGLPSGQGLGSILFIYFAMLLPFVLLIVWVIKKYGNSKNTLIALSLFALSYILRILVVDVINGDYKFCLSKWVAEYRSLSIKDCFVKQVGNYAPFYNYFLILFSRLPIYDLYLIKTLSFYFEVVTAIIVMKLIAKAKQTQSNPLYLAITLLLLIPLLNSSQWGQCDTIYTFFAVAGIYFAVNRKSILCFVMMGLSLSFKLQSILIYPVVLILLLCKNSNGEKYLSWKDIWYTPLVFVLINIIPAFFGGSIFKVIYVYLDQVLVGNVGHGLCGNCANIFLQLSTVIKESSIFYPILTFIFIGIVAVMLAIVIIRVYQTKKNSLEILDVLFFAAFLPLISIFFMPKMLDRYYYIAEIFMFVYMMVSSNKKLMLTTYLALEVGVLLTYCSALSLLDYNIMLYTANIFTAISVVIMIINFVLNFLSKSSKNISDAIKENSNALDSAVNN